MGIHSGGVNVIPPRTILSYEFDKIIISRSVHAKEIISFLVEELEVPRDKIVVFMPEQAGIEWGDERIVMLRRCIDMIKERAVDGSMAEVGVYRGDFAKLMNRYMPERRLYLCDTFCGFDATRDAVDEKDLCRFHDTSVEIVMQKMIRPQSCIIKKGYFPDTMKDIDDDFCLVSLDADLYEPMFNGLQFFYPRLVRGGYIFVHDFEVVHFSGVRKAVYDFLESSSASVLPISDWQGSVVITK